MNYSYVMGIDNIDLLKQNNFEIKEFGDNYGVIFSDEKIGIYEEFICNSLPNGFWNEYLGKEKVFIFKFEDGTLNRFVLNNANEKEILKLCCDFAECEFTSIMDMLKDNKFYNNTYFNEAK